MGFAQISPVRRYSLRYRFGRPIGTQFFVVLRMLTAENISGNGVASATKRSLCVGIFSSSMFQQRSDAKTETGPMRKHQSHIADRFRGFFSFGPTRQRYGFCAFLSVIGYLLRT